MTAANLSWSAFALQTVQSQYPTQKTRMRTSFDPELELPKLQRWFAENQHPSRQQVSCYALSDLYLHQIWMQGQPSKHLNVENETATPIYFCSRNLKKIMWNRNRRKLHGEELWYLHSSRCCYNDQPSNMAKQNVRKCIWCRFCCFVRELQTFHEDVRRNSVIVFQFLQSGTFLTGPVCVNVCKRTRTCTLKVRL